MIIEFFFVYKTHMMKLIKITVTLFNLRLLPNSVHLVYNHPIFWSIRVVSGLFFLVCVLCKYLHINCYLSDFVTYVAMFHVMQTIVICFIKIGYLFYVVYTNAVIIECNTILLITLLLLKLVIFITVELFGVLVIIGIDTLFDILGVIFELHRDNKYKGTRL